MECETRVGKKPSLDIQLLGDLWMKPEKTQGIIFDAIDLGTRKDYWEARIDLVAPLTGKNPKALNVPLFQSELRDVLLKTKEKLNGEDGPEYGKAFNLADKYIGKYTKLARHDLEKNNESNPRFPLNTAATINGLESLRRDVDAIKQLKEMVKK